tara:strand:- start:224 stop:523 length:300 start_codon:yes stop_codon:yes gene_type:complete
MTEEVEVGQKWTSSLGLTVTVKRVGSAREVFKDHRGSLSNKKIIQGVGDVINTPNLEMDTDTWVLTEWQVLPDEDPDKDEFIGESRLRLESFLNIYKKN